MKFGTPARLFPVVADAQKEQKSLSIVLASMISVRPFAQILLSSLDVKFGKRSKIACYTEITLTNEAEGSKDRPDGLIVVETGAKSWTAIVEAKVGKSSVEKDQLARYISLAKANNIDAVLTISNDLTISPSVNPTNLYKALPRNLALYHLSWASILTSAYLLVSAKTDPFENDDEAFIIGELVRYLENKQSGVQRLDQMNREWPRIVAGVQAGHPANSKAVEVQEMVSIWHQEARDVALIMSRKLKVPVTLAVSRNKIDNHAKWVEEGIKEFCNSNILRFDLNVTNAAGPIKVEADFLRRAIRVSMKLSSPNNRANNSARVNWLLRQLHKSDRTKVIIRCITRGKAANFGAMAHELDAKSDKVKSLTDITSFEIEMSDDLGARFNSRKKFIENLESLVQDFYQNVGQYLQAWVAPPPKLKAQSDEPTILETEDKKDHDSHGQEPHGVAPRTTFSGGEYSATPKRPDWVTGWQHKISEDF